MNDEHVRACVSCGRKVDIRIESWRFPCPWGCPLELRQKREASPDLPTCIDCLPAIFKTPFLGGGKPVLSAADLPKPGEPVPSHMILREKP